MVNCSYEVVFYLSETVPKQVVNKVEELVETAKNKLSYPDKFKHSLKIVGNKLVLKVDSEERTATQFVLFFNSKLKKFLGDECRIGVKGFDLVNYELVFEVNKKPLKSFSVPFVTKLEFKGSTVKLFYKKVDDSFVRNNNVERTINLVEEKILKQYYEGKGEYHEILETSEKREPAWNKDPTEEMVKKGWLVRGPTKGKWFYGPQVTAIIRALERVVLEKFLQPLGFQEVITSNVVSGEEVWLRTGHLAGMPMEIYYVAEPKTRNVEEWSSFIDKLKITRNIPYDEFSHLIKWKPLQGLTYAQCPLIYWSFKNKTISVKDLPIKVYSKAQISLRYESGGRHGVERVDEFHRIEPVFIGTPEQMIKLRDEALKAYKQIFNKVLELEWRTAWVTPFYMQHAGDEFKQDYEQKIKGTIDFEAWLPFRGSREESEWLEFQNFSIVGDKYTKAFNIKAQKGELWSGCTGIGLQRWLVAFLAQKGLNPNNWPEGFKKYLPELPKEITFY